MQLSLPDTPHSLLSQLRASSHGNDWQVSWGMFLELYQEPLQAMAANSYRHHTGNARPSQEFIEDAVANVVVDFFSKSQFRYHPDRGRLRGFLRALCNARVVDLLRKQRPLDHLPLAECDYDADSLTAELPLESDEEINAFRQSLLVTLIEDLRSRVSAQQFTIFEMVKLKGVSPEQVAEELGVRRAVIDNTIYKSVKILRDLAAQPEYQEEYTG